MHAVVPEGATARADGRQPARQRLWQLLAPRSSGRTRRRILGVVDEGLAIYLDQVGSKRGKRRQEGRQQQAELAGTEFQGEILNYRKDGNTFWNELTISCIRNAQGHPTHYIGIIRDITDRRKIEEALQMSIKDKVALLNEVHHRVKNNLQVITSLPRLESGRSGQPETQAALGNMQSRIRSMELLHQMLYRSGVFASVDLGRYIEQIAQQAFRFQTPDSRAIRLRLSLSSVAVNLDQAAPIGLIVAELISNCLKHGFPAGRSGEVSLDLQPVAGTSRWHLRIRDDGVGLAADYTERRNASLGLKLVEDLSRQCGGVLAVETDAATGTVFTVTFSPDNPAFAPAQT